MTRFLYRSGRWAALHPWRAVAGWLTFTALLLGLAAGAVLLGAAVIWAVLGSGSEPLSAGSLPSSAPRSRCR